MHPETIVEFWERLERFNWFYAFTESVESFESDTEELLAIHKIARQSYDHLQLMGSFEVQMYRNVELSLDDEAMNLKKPKHNKAESA